MKIIKLTKTYENREVFINADYIISYFETFNDNNWMDNTPDYTTISLVGGQCFDIKESASEIYNLIFIL